MRAREVTACRPKPNGNTLPKLIAELTLLLTCGAARNTCVTSRATLPMSLQKVSKLSFYVVTMTVLPVKPLSAALKQNVAAFLI